MHPWCPEVKVAVVGAGGVGSVSGGRLAAADHEVWLVHRRPEVVEALEDHGLHLPSPTGDEHIAVHATCDTGHVGPVDLVLILTKSKVPTPYNEALLLLVKARVQMLASA